MHNEPKKLTQVQINMNSWNHSTVRRFQHSIELVYKVDTGHNLADLFTEVLDKKKHNSICFHRIREMVAAGIMVVLKVKSEFNLADILTKSLPPETRKRLRGLIMINTE